MAIVQGTNKLIAQLRSRAKEAEGLSYRHVLVGYKAKYAIFVHENMQAHHPAGQAKFLEIPMRRMQRERVAAAHVRRAVKRGLGVERGLLNFGMELQRASQALVPVDTGYLKASAFTRLRRTGEGVG